jgi:hypothetical protein
MLLNINANRDATDREAEHTEARPFAVDRRRLFTMAWTQARIIARRFGGTARKHFAGCLKGAWKQLRPAQAAPIAFPSRRIAAEMQRQQVQPPRWRYANAFYVR